MTAGASELADLQRRMHAALLDPEGVPEEAAAVVTGSSRLTPRQRLDIYWKGYRLRLLESMRGLHPGLVQLLGREMFDRFALDYLDARPPRAYTLFRLDEGFAAHLARNRPDAGNPAGRRERWPDLIIDLARYERIITEVMDGPGTEECTVLTPADLPGPAALPGLRLAAAPCLRLPRLTFPAHEYLADVRRGGDPGLPAPRPVHLAVSRREYRVTVRELGPADHWALQALAEGATAGTALHGVQEEQALVRLRHWTELGLFIRAEWLGAAREPRTAGAPRPSAQ